MYCIASILSKPVVVISKQNNCPGEADAEPAERENPPTKACGSIVGILFSQAGFVPEAVAKQQQNKQQVRKNDRLFDKFME